MATEITEITEGYEPDIESYLKHVITDLHDVIKRLQVQGLLMEKHDALLEEFRPLLDQFRSPLASRMTRRRNGNG